MVCDNAKCTVSHAKSRRRFSQLRCPSIERDGRLAGLCAGRKNHGPSNNTSWYRNENLQLVTDEISGVQRGGYHDNLNRLQTVQDLAAPGRYGASNRVGGSDRHQHS